MEDSILHCLTEKVDHGQAVSTLQQQNLNILLGLSDGFHVDAGIPSEPACQPTGTTIVLESGHQPNFLPFPGVWKKVFLLDRLARYLGEENRDTIAVFGFADQNLSTARLLYENKVPAINKQGSRKFGFKIRDTGRWKRFNTIKKPSREDWERDLEELKDHYSQYIKNDPSHGIPAHIDDLIGILEACYLRARNMADLNAFVFARICKETFDLHVHFFRYSNVQNVALFKEEWVRVFASAWTYPANYNTIIRTDNIRLSPVPSDYFPFWFHCPCGAKVAVSLDNPDTCKGTCPLCTTEFSLDLSNPSLQDSLLKDMGMSAVVRNMIFAEGLGTRIFISGSGGGLRYGRVANTLSENLSMNIPITLSWQSRDYYLGVVHKAVLNDLKHLFHISPDDIITGSANDTISGFLKKELNRIQALEGESDTKHEIARHSGMYRNAERQIGITRNVFSTIPSILDLLVNFSGPTIIRSWDDAICHATIDEEGKFVRLKQDVTYLPDGSKGFKAPEIPRIYHAVDAMKDL